MKTAMTQLFQSWKAGDMAQVRAIVKRTSKIKAMNFAVLIALTEGGEAANRLLRLMAGYELWPCAAIGLAGRRPHGGGQSGRQFASVPPQYSGDGPVRSQTLPALDLPILDYVRERRTIVRIMRTKKPLDALIGATRQKVLSRTHLQPERWWYLHELARSLNLRPSSIQRDAAILAAAGVLLRREDGNRVYFKADPACPIFSEIRDLLIKTVALVDVLRNALKPFASRIRIAFVYGSMASSEERSTSDVDLMIIGSFRLAEAAAALRGLEAQLGRSINPTVYTPTEFAKKLGTGNNFLKTVAASKKLLLFGKEDDLADIVGERADQAP